MTDSEMKRIFESLISEENDLSETELAISILVALGMAKQYEIDKARNVPSER